MCTELELATEGFQTKFSFVGSLQFSNDKYFKVKESPAELKYYYYYSYCVIFWAIADELDFTRL